MATNVIARWPPKRRPTGMPHARANIDTNTDNDADIKSNTDNDANTNTITSTDTNTNTDIDTNTNTDTDTNTDSPTLHSFKEALAVCRSFLDRVVIFAVC